MNFYTTAPVEVLQLVLEYGEYDTVKRELMAETRQCVEDLPKAYVVSRCDGWLCIQVWAMMRPVFNRKTAKWSLGPKLQLQELLQEEITFSLDCPWHMLV